MSDFVQEDATTVPRKESENSIEDKAPVSSWEDDIQAVKVEEIEVNNDEAKTTPNKQEPEDDDNKHTRHGKDVSFKLDSDEPLGGDASGLSNPLKDTPVRSSIGETEDEDEPKKESIQDLRQWIRKTSIRVKSFTGKPGDFGEPSPSSSPANKTPVTTPSHQSTANRSLLPASSQRPTTTASSTSAGAVGGGINKPVSYAVPVQVSNASTSQTPSSMAARTPSQPYDDLVRRNKVKEYEGFVQTELETYLDDADFVKVFGKNRGDFYQQARWKQIDQKKRAQLF